MARAPKRHKKVCWDSCAWIAYIQDEKIPLSNGSVENRGALCRAVLDSAAKGATDIYTSALSLAEVNKQPTGTPPGTDKLKDFFENDYIVIVQLNRYLGEMARSFIQAGHAGLKPLDAVHLASAVISNVDELNTFDIALLALDGKITKSDGSPLEICKPSMGGPPPPLFETVAQDGADDDEQAEQAETPTEAESSPVHASGEGVGLPGGRSGVREGAEADNGSRADTEASAEETAQEELTEDQIEALEDDEIMADLDKLEPPQSP
jgi:predicted nucleic acid-binding protein